VLPHASVALYVLIVVSVQLTVLTASPTNVIATAPVQLSVAVTEVISAAGTVALHAKFKVAGQLIVGGVTSTVHVTVREVVAVLLQASVAVKVLVCDLPQPAIVTAPSAEVTVGVPHPSVAVALPRAASICPAVGLQPAFNVVPVAVITGGVLSFDQETVRAVVAVLPHASVAVNVLVCVVIQPEVV